MPWIRYLTYFFGVAFVTYALTQMEIAAPGSLKLHVFVEPTDKFGTSEFSPVELIQAIVLLTCGAIMAWVAHYCHGQRTVAVLFGGLALMFLIRELHFFFDRYLIDNLWQALVGVAGALVIAYSYRHRRRLQLAFIRLWPSPGLTLLFCGALIIFAFVSLVGHEPLWQSILGSEYKRVIKLAVEEFFELIGYFIWLIGTIEFALQARAISSLEPLPAAQRRRAKRKRPSKRKF